jgi:Integrase core domain
MVNCSSLASRSLSRRRAVHVSRPTVPGLADLSDQSCRRHRGHRSLRPADDYIPAALLPCDSAPRTPTVGIVRGDEKFDCGVDFAPNHRGVPLGQCTSLPYSGRDTAYGPLFVQRLRAMGIRDKPIAPRSPWQNPYVERLIGTIRRECLDYMIVFGQAHLCRILGKFAAYYNESRIHRSLGEDAPFHRAIERVGAITSQPVLGGLHHQYCRI